MKANWVNLIIILNNFCLLLVRNTNYKGLDFGEGYFDLPGGRIEDNETALEALERELKEETSLSIINLDNLEIFHQDSIQFPDFTRVNFYFKGYLHGDNDIILSNEHKSYVWLDMKKLSDCCPIMMPIHLNALKVYKEQGY